MTTKASSASSSKTAAAEGEGGTVHLVFQRYRQCRILINQEKWEVVGTSSNKNIQNHNHHNATDEEETADHGHHHHHHHCGLLVYVSFAKGATKTSVQAAAHTILHLPLLTTGLWGDGTSQQLSLMELVTKTTTTQSSDDRESEHAENKNGRNKKSSRTSLVLCPQANLIGKLKGRSQMQYRGQIEKEQGRALFHYLASCLIGSLLEQQCQCHASSSSSSLSSNSLPESYRRWKEYEQAQEQKLAYEQEQRNRQESQPHPSIPPQKVFQPPHCSLYSAWDDVTGLPTHYSCTGSNDMENENENENADHDTLATTTTKIRGEPLTKSATKKLKKMLEAHTKRHEKWLLQQQQLENTTTTDETKQDSSSFPSQQQQPGDEARPERKPQVEPSAAETNDTTEHRSNGGGVQSWWQELDPAFCPVIVGSFGKRQGLEFSSDMGPFCHVVQTS